MNAKLFRIALAALVIGGIAIGIAFRDQLNTTAMEQWISSFGMAGPIVFMAIYAIGTVLFFPGAVLTLAGGAMFGPVWGTLYNLTGATIGAAIAFLIARYLASDWVE